MYLEKPGSASGAPFSFSVDFPGDCETTFDLICDPDKEDVLLGKKPQKRLDSGPIGVGSQWTTRYGPMDLPFFKNTLRYTRFDRPRSFSRTTSGSVEGDADVFFEPVGDGTRVTMTLTIRKLPWIVSRADYEVVQKSFLQQIRDALLARS